VDRASVSGEHTGHPVPVYGQGAGQRDRAVLLRRAVPGRTDEQVVER